MKFLFMFSGGRTAIVVASKKSKAKGKLRRSMPASLLDRGRLPYGQFAPSSYDDKSLTAPTPAKAKLQCRRIG